MIPLDVVTKFDRLLSERGMAFEAVVIGGAALNILGVISRETQDVDVLEPLIDPKILQASKDFASKTGIGVTSLKENLLNHGPESLRKYLRKDWRARLQPLFQGAAITFTTLGRVDLIGTKLLAYCDRGRDLNDCLDLKPTKEEILEILPWVQGYDGKLKMAAICSGSIK